MKTVRLCVAAGLLLILAVFCDRHNEFTEDASGKMIAVHVSILGVREGPSEEIMRSASGSPKTIAEALKPIGNGMLLDMSLEEDEWPSLRATTQNLEVNKLFRVIAVNTSDGRCVSYGDYKITAAGVELTGGGLHVPANVSHDFICISYNSTTLGFGGGYSEGATVADLAVPTDGRDLLYDSALGKTFSNAASATLSFTLIHKLSKVTLVVDGTYNGFNITAIASNKIHLSPSYSNAKINLRTGVIAAGSTGGYQYFTWPSSMSAAQTQSSTRAVYTSNGTISVSVLAGAVTINGTGRPSAEQTISFPTAVTLATGYNYTLRVKMRVPKFAGSNIYWNGSALVFDGYGSTGNQGVQGVFFKWGSLWGISPGQTAGAGNNGADFTNATPVYKTTGKSTVASWADIPYWDSGDVIDNTKYASYKGDICEYLNSGYRLPKSEEFGTLVNTVLLGWSWGGNKDGVTGTWSDDGRTAIMGGSYNGRYVMNSVLGITLPASGYRMEDGFLYRVSATGNYWDSTGYSDCCGFYIYFSGDVLGTSPNYRYSAGSVRCVMK
jgi:hypothetical protein